MRMRERAPEQISGTAAYWTPILQVQAGLIAFARGVVGDAELARDITQDTYVDAWRAFQQGIAPFAMNAAETPADLTGIRRWLFTVTYRRALKHLRRRKTIAWESLDARVEADPALLLAPPRFEDTVAEAEALQLALLHVGPEDAASFLLQTIYGFSTAEIATILAAQPDAVRKRLSRARQRLRDAYIAQSQPSPNAQSREEQRP